VLNDILINNNTTCKFVDIEGAENVIYCRPFEESLDNVAVIVTNGSEFVHKIITESTGDNYLVTSVQLSDGEVFDNVKFKLAVCEEVELPHSTIDTLAFDLPSDFHEISAPPALIRESNSNYAATTAPINYTKHLRSYLNKIIKSKAL